AGIRRGPSHPQLPSGEYLGGGLSSDTSPPAAPVPCDGPLKGEWHAAWLPFCAQTTRLGGSSMEFLPTALLMARAAAAASSALKASDLLTSRVGRPGCACAATLRPGGLPQSI